MAKPGIVTNKPPGTTNTAHGDLVEPSIVSTRQDVLESKPEMQNGASFDRSDFFATRDRRSELRMSGC